jgi:hypothetical protein
VFTAWYGLIAYIQQIVFRSLKVKYVMNLIMQLREVGLHAGLSEDPDEA